MYSSFSGVIVSFGIGLYLLLSSHSEWEAIGAGLVASGFLLIGPFAGFFCSAIVAILVYFPTYIASRQFAKLPIFLLPITGALVGILAALFFKAWMGNLLLSVYLLFAFWGALGGCLFAFGAEHEKSN